MVTCTLHSVLLCGDFLITHGSYRLEEERVFLGVTAVSHFIKITICQCAQVTRISANSKNALCLCGGDLSSFARTSKICMVQQLLDSASYLCCNIHNKANG